MHTFDRKCVGCRYFSCNRSCRRDNSKFIQGSLSPCFKDNTKLVCQGRRSQEPLQSLKCRTDNNENTKNLELAEFSLLDVVELLESSEIMFFSSFFFLSTLTIRGNVKKVLWYFTDQFNLCLKWQQIF